jgi:hypothetical protein
MLDSASYRTRTPSHTEITNDFLDLAGLVDSSILIKSGLKQLSIAQPWFLFNHDSRQI